MRRNYELSEKLQKINERVNCATDLLFDPEFKNLTLQELIDLFGEEIRADDRDNTVRIKFRVFCNSYRDIDPNPHSPSAVNFPGALKEDEYVNKSKDDIKSETENKTGYVDTDSVEADPECENCSIKELLDEYHNIKKMINQKFGIESVPDIHIMNILKNRKKEDQEESEKKGDNDEMSEVLTKLHKLIFGDHCDNSENNDFLNRMCGNIRKATFQKDDKENSEDSHLGMSEIKSIDELFDLIFGGGETTDK